MATWFSELHICKYRLKIKKLICDENRTKFAEAAQAHGRESTFTAHKLVPPLLDSNFEIFAKKVPLKSIILSSIANAIVFCFRLWAYSKVNRIESCEIDPIALRSTIHWGQKSNLTISDTQLRFQTNAVHAMRWIIRLRNHDESVNIGTHYTNADLLSLHHL